MTDYVGKQIDVKGLKSLYNENKVAICMLDHFGRRRNNPSTTNVETLERALNHQATRTEIIQALRALEEVGCGTFIVGRKGRSSRFEWNAPATSVAAVAKGDSTTVEPFTDEEVSKLQAESSDEDAGPGIGIGEEATQEDERQMLVHRFRLRRDLELTISLPADLTAAEASRLADFVRALPFE